MSDPYAPMLSETARRVAETERRLRDAETVENGYSMGDAIGTMQGLPGLRACWPFSSVNESGGVMDLSGQGRTLTTTGNSWGIENQIVRYAGLNGTTQYFSRADEAGLESSGALTFGGWFYLSSFAATQIVFAKYNITGNQRSFALQANTGDGKWTVLVSADGITPITKPGAAVVPSRWQFVVGRFTPSSELAVFVGNDKQTLTAGVPAALFNSSAALTIGVRGDLSQYMHGRATLLFLCAEALPDALINRFYNITRTLLGV